jgi:hypothetical protein
MNYITLILLVVASIVVGVVLIALFAKITLQDKEILFWAKSQAKAVQLVDVNMKGIQSLQKVTLYHQGLLKQLVECNQEGGFVVYNKEMQKLEKEATDSLAIHNKVLTAFTKEYFDDENINESKLAQEQLQSQLDDILNGSPNKDSSG